MTDPRQTIADALERVISRSAYATVHSENVVELARIATEALDGTDDLRRKIIAATEDAIQQSQRAERLAAALEFYANFETWWAVMLMADRPCGDIMEDFDIDPNDSHQLERPGKRARAVLHEGDLP